MQSTATPTGESAEQAKQVIDTATSMPEWSDIDVERVIADLVPVVVAVALRVLAVLVLLFVAWLIARGVKRAVSGSLRRTKVDETVRRFATHAAGWAIIVLAIILSLGIFGMNTTVFAGILGAIGLALGFGFQGALANFAAGVLLLVFRPFRVGDLVELDGELGVVEEIELYFTRINKFDKRHVILPNDDVLGHKIENVSRNRLRRIEVPVGVSYAADPDETRAALEKAMSKVEGRVDDEGNSVVLLGYGDSSVNWEVRVVGEWQDWLTIQQSIVREIWYALDEAGIIIPFPQRDLHVPGPVSVRLENGSSS